MEITQPLAACEYADVIIIGGGLAGLISAIELSSCGFKVILFEKKKYPFNKVCGEYVSNEVLSYLKKLGFDPHQHGASNIDRLRISSPSGKNYFISLTLGGFGLSRFKLDNELADIARLNGTIIHENCRVTDVTFTGNGFTVIAGENNYKSSFVFGCYGKRDTLDKKLDRDFINRHTGYLGVKYHIKTVYPQNEIGLDNFSGGYCGIVKIEDDRYNLCYLYRRNNKDDFRSIDELQEKILFRNPVIRNYFLRSEFIFKKPEVINEISFDRKSCVEDHVLMCGDAAGLITPLCGNGMAMAVHGGKILSDTVKQFFNPGESITVKSRGDLEMKYIMKWNNVFKSRLYWGRHIQLFSGNSFLTTTFLNTVHAIPKFENWLIKKTHGKEVA